ncbi:MAG: cation transporter [Phycisphaerales bacterium]|nr:MAG: cation transporter [Phycisphaerales bacterium]
MAGSSRKVIFAALIGNGLIAITKFIAAAVTGSSAMLSEGIHSVVDTGNQVLLLWGLKCAKKPPDERFPFGHGKEVYFWSFVVAIMIFAVGAGVSLYEGIHHLLHPTPIERPAVNYVVIALAVVFEGVAWYFAFTEFTKAKGKWGYFEAVHRGKDPSIFVVLFEDSAAMIGLIAAFLGVLLSHVTGIMIFDGIASIVIGLVLGGTAAWLAYETKSLLIGESATKPVVRGIREIVSAHPDVMRVNELLTMHMGPDFILLNVSVDFRDEATAGELEQAIARMDREIKEAYPEVRRIFIEAESARESADPAPMEDA